MPPRRASARILASGRTVYGVNTGFGLLAQTRIPTTGWPSCSPTSSSRTCLRARRAAARRGSCGWRWSSRRSASARGHRGVRRIVVERLLALLEADALPVIPSQGSVGASGDLAPLAHLSAALLGEGEIAARRRIAARRPRRWRGSGWRRSRSGPRKGLALINGTQISTAIALDVLFTAERVFATGARRRRAFDRRAQGQRRAVRCPHPRAARPARPDRGRRRIARAARRQRRSREPHADCEQGAGPLQLPLPAAGDGRRAGPDPQCRRARSRSRPMP